MKKPNWDGWETDACVEGYTCYRKGPVTLTRCKGGNGVKTYWGGDLQIDGEMVASCTSLTLEAVCDMLVTYITNEMGAENEHIADMILAIFQKELI